jgi:hypothetical protein
VVRTFSISCGLTYNACTRPERETNMSDIKHPENQNAENEDLDNRDVDDDQLDQAVEETFPASDPISP